MNNSNVLLLFFGKGAVNALAQNAAHAQDRSQRGAKLLGHVGDEAGFNRCGSAFGSESGLRGTSNQAIALKLTHAPACHELQKVDFFAGKAARFQFHNC